MLMIGKTGGKSLKKKRSAANCEYCSNYIYDEEWGYYICDMPLDEDEMGK